MRIFHFSEQPGIEFFSPRPPQNHPTAEPFVYAIEELYSPLYYFPRDCPRIAHWTDPTQISLWIDADWEERWRSASIYRYEFCNAGFECCDDHGVWVSRLDQSPTACELLTNLDQHIQAKVIIVADLAEQAKEFIDFETREWQRPGHTSMIRMRNLPGWVGPKGRPARPQA